MYELVIAGGWLMLPIILCSVVSTAIIIERLWSLRRPRVVPDNLVAQADLLIQQGKTAEAIPLIESAKEKVDF